MPPPTIRATSRWSSPAARTSSSRSTTPAASRSGSSATQASTGMAFPRWPRAAWHWPPAYPIGQDAVSITHDGLLLLFNNGLGSLNQPAGAPAGESRSYSAVSAYAIDVASRSAQEAWRFDHGQSILSDFCSSAYESGAGASVLVSYAVADGRTHARPGWPGRRPRRGVR